MKYFSIHTVLLVFLLFVYSCNKKEGPVNNKEQEILEEKITFTSDSLQLNGTLLLPIEEGKSPAALIIPGSGAVDKDGRLVNTPATNPPIYKEWAEYLAKEDIAVLRYNKRFISYPDINVKNLSFIDMVDDARAAIKYLKGRPEVDAESIFILGHSQGGNIAPVTINDETTSVAGFSLLATSNISVDTLLVEQLRANPNIPDSLVNEVRKDFKALRNGGIKKVEILGAGITFWEEWIQYSEHADSIIKSIRKPTLIIQGNEDENFPGSTLIRNKEGWSRVAEQREEIRFKDYDGVTHLMLKENVNTVSKDVLSDLKKWIKATN